MRDVDESGGGEGGTCLESQGWGDVRNWALFLVENELPAQC